LGRRKFLRELGEGASFAFLPSGLRNFPFPSLPQQQTSVPPAFHVHPEYRNPRELEAVLRKVKAGYDSFITEKYQDQVAGHLAEWTAELLQSPHQTGTLQKSLSERFLGASPIPANSQRIRPDSFLNISRLTFSREASLGATPFLEQWRSSMDSFSKLFTA
jgi:hypothetical protein